MTSTTGLVVVGAGPKAISVIAKAEAVRRCGGSVPEITVVESGRIGGNWREGSGWTDGHLSLGTSPLKDIGFPYSSRFSLSAEHDVDTVLAELSWPNHLRLTGGYSDWVDRGCPAPQHREWGQYLAWVAESVGCRPVRGKVVSADIEDGWWVVGIDEGNGNPRIIRSRSLMPTGPGSAVTRFGDVPGLFSQEDFWSSRGDLSRFVGSSVVVIGSGESAAGVISRLAEVGPARVTIVAPGAAVYSRGEGFFENRLYSEPDGWALLSVPQRREFIRRTDRGVFSGDLVSRFSGVGQLTHVSARVSGVRGSGEGPVVDVVKSDGTAESLTADSVVDASGGDPLWFTSLFGPETHRLVMGGRGDSAAVLEARMGHDLSVEGLDPKLFLPTLSMLNQGPGFGNLSCLGELSDRVLSGLGVEPGESSRVETA
ncbi:SidA/IucD/PvdA family monooxygenase [Corynebacterium pygosceleis]|uniref:SidA/IucD/PvdA family monooxygenase n=1 Tax=Corynebacterium pygosceleis TaxID=2800406 RepID=UPI0020055581|nr:SidA/IucD/PvdA family monooxygenase [Corynebacterium pygosceleis]